MKKIFWMGPRMPSSWVIHTSVLFHSCNGSLLPSVQSRWTQHFSPVLPCAVNHLVSRQGYNELSAMVSGRMLTAFRYVSIRIRTASQRKN